MGVYSAVCILWESILWCVYYIGVYFLLCVLCGRIYIYIYIFNGSIFCVVCIMWEYILCCLYFVGVYSLLCVLCGSIFSVVCIMWEYILCVWLAVSDTFLYWARVTVISRGIQYITLMAGHILGTSQLTRHTYYIVFS